MEESGNERSGKMAGLLCEMNEEKKAIKQNGKIQEKPSAVSEKFRNPL